MAEQVGSNSKSGMKRFILCVVYLAVAAVPLSVGVFRPGMNHYHKARVADMVYGRAHQPFVRRQLVPLMVQVGVAVMPEAVLKQLQDKFAKSELVKRLGWDAEYAGEFVAAVILMYGALLGFLLVLRLFLVQFFELTGIKSHGVVWVVGLLLPATFCGVLYIYDFAQLLLFTAGALLMRQKRWGLFYPVFILGYLNKETTILLPVVFVVYCGWRILQWENLRHFLGQMALGLVIVGMLSWIFQGNPGGAAEWHLERNLHPGLTGLGWARLIILLVAVVLCLVGISRAPGFLRRGWLATMPILLVATFFLGYIDELRDYYEALPFTVGLILLTLGARVKSKVDVLSSDAIPASD
ncbi:MAG: hypothetical protein JXD22_16800 [Sedimentisphaerales bacterium]|nr:hypothetical protein [Sedimentisphaerales bacterium]